MFLFPEYSVLRNDDSCNCACPSIGQLSEQSVIRRKWGCKHGGGVFHCVRTLLPINLSKVRMSIVVLCLVATIPLQAQSDDNRKLPLAESVFTTNLMGNPNLTTYGDGGGSFQTSKFFGTYFAPRLRACQSPILLATRSWAEQLQLSIVKSIVEEKSLLIHAAKRAADGFLEIWYLIEDNNSRADLQIFYISSTGAEIEPQLMANGITPESLSEFVDLLHEAITCGR